MRAYANKIDWDRKNEYNHSGIFRGVYEGQLNDRQEPHGQGKWKSTEYDITIEGEWKGGKLHGKAFKKYYESYVFYEAKDGLIEGKYIRRST